MRKLGTFLYLLLLLITGSFLNNSLLAQPQIEPFVGPEGGNVQSFHKTVDNAIYAVGDLNLFISRNDGNSWEEIRLVSNLSQMLIQDTYYDSESDYLYVLTALNILIVKGDKVENQISKESIDVFPGRWDNIAAKGDRLLLLISTSNSLNVLQSYDAGKSWSLTDQIEVPVSYKKSEVTFLDNEEAIVTNFSRVYLIKKDTVEVFTPFGPFPSYNSPVITDKSTFKEESFTAVEKGTDGRLFVGTPRGIIFSDDTAKTWKNTSITDYSVGLYANKMGQIFTGSLNDTPWYSSDNGDSWVSVKTPFESGTFFKDIINDVVVTESGNLLAGFYRILSFNNDIYRRSMGQGYGVFKLNSENENWSKSSSGFSALYTDAYSTDFTTEFIYVPTLGVLKREVDQPWSKVGKSDSIQSNFHVREGHYHEGERETGWSIIWDKGSNLYQIPGSTAPILAFDFGKTGFFRLDDSNQWIKDKVSETNLPSDSTILSEDAVFTTRHLGLNMNLLYTHNFRNVFLESIPLNAVDAVSFEDSVYFLTWGWKSVGLSSRPINKAEYSTLYKIDSLSSKTSENELMLTYNLAADYANKKIIVLRPEMQDKEISIFMDKFSPDNNLLNSIKLSVKSDAGRGMRNLVPVETFVADGRILVVLAYHLNPPQNDQIASGIYYLSGNELMPVRDSMEEIVTYRSVGGFEPKLELQRGLNNNVIIRKDGQVRGTLSLTDIPLSSHEEFGSLKPSKTKLLSNYPNPFNPTTTFRYELSSTDSPVITIYSLLGQKVRTLSPGQQSAGFHEISFDGTGLASGIYFYQLRTSDEVFQRSMTLIK